MDISSNNPAKLLARILKHGYKRKISRKQMNLFLKAAQKNVSRINYVEARIDHMQQNSKCWLCGKIDGTVNYIRECSKLAQRGYKTRLDWVEKEIRSKLCKKFKFDHTTKWYMHKPESALTNEMHKFYEIL